MCVFQGLTGEPVKTCKPPVSGANFYLRTDILGIIRILLAATDRGSKVHAVPVRAVINVDPWFFSTTAWKTTKLRIKGAGLWAYRAVSVSRFLPASFIVVADEIAEYVRSASSCLCFCRRLCRCC